MNRLESWLVNLTGEHYLWVFELFVIVLIALSLGLVLNRVIDKLEVQAAKTKTVWDDAIIEACRRPAIWLIWILGINFAAGIAAQKMDSPLQAMIAPLITSPSSPKISGVTPLFVRAMLSCSAATIESY